MAVARHDLLGEPVHSALSARGARILRLAPGAATLLARESAGRVHSVFERSVNLQGGDGRLLTLHGPGWLRAPFAAACDQLPAVAPGTRVRLGPRGVQIDGNLLACDSDTRLAGSAPPPASDTRTLGARLGDAGRGASPVLARHAPALAAAIMAVDAGELSTVARALIGCGEGLTPAGDDCLVGALAALWHYGPGWAARIRRLRDTLAAVAEDATTTIAAEFIRYGLVGHFAEPLVHALATGDAAPLLAYGATSGADTLFGAAVALGALSS